MRPPSGVNFTALESRFSTICLSRRWSATRRMPWPIRAVSLSCLSSARPDTTRIASLRNGSSSTCSGSSRIRPASILDMSRTSLITSSRYWPLWWMSEQYSRYLSVPRGPNMPAAMISENPIIALSGVRSSWLILARNFDFAWLASSARVFSSAYFSARSATSSACRSSFCCEWRRSATVAIKRFSLSISFSSCSLMLVMSVPTET